tara:strand:+ start:102 stop:482 length:381 start_codon:yes stop_codon:yes gene_type:complete
MDKKLDRIRRAKPGVRNRKKLYVLELEDECYYVGIASDIKHRFESHMSGYGSKWTKLHKPLPKDEPMLELEIGVGVKNPFNLITVDEATVTYHLMSERGFDKVRGSAWSQCVLPGKPHKPKWLKYY